MDVEPPIIQPFFRLLEIEGYLILRQVIKQRGERELYCRGKNLEERMEGEKKPKRSGFLFLGRSSFSCYVTCCILHQRADWFGTAHTYRSLPAGALKLCSQFERTSTITYCCLYGPYHPKSTKHSYTPDLSNTIG